MDERDIKRVKRLQGDTTKGWVDKIPVRVYLSLEKFMGQQLSETLTIVAWNKSQNKDK